MKKKYLLKFNEYNVLYLTMLSEKKHYNNLNSICFRLVEEVYGINSSEDVDYEKYSCLYRVATAFEKKIIEITKQYKVQTIIKKTYTLKITQIICENKTIQERIIDNINSVITYLCLLRNELWEKARGYNEFTF